MFLNTKKYSERCFIIILILFQWFQSRQPTRKCKFKALPSLLAAQHVPAEPGSNHFPNQYLL